MPSVLLWERTFHLFWFLHVDVDTSWFTACKNLTHDENIPFIFLLTVTASPPLPTPRCFLYGKLALRSIFLSYPLQNSCFCKTCICLKNLENIYISVKMIDGLDITDDYSVACDFILNTDIFIDAALNISLRKKKKRKCNVLWFYLLGQGVPNETKGTNNLNGRNLQQLTRVYVKRKILILGVCPPLPRGYIYV